MSISFEKHPWSPPIWSYWFYLFRREKGLYFAGRGKYTCVLMWIVFIVSVNVCYVLKSFKSDFRRQYKTEIVMIQSLFLFCWIDRTQNHATCSINKSDAACYLLQTLWTMNKWGTTNRRLSVTPENIYPHLHSEFYSDSQTKRRHTVIMAKYCSNHKKL